MYTKEVTFTETASPGVYTGTIAVPAGTRLLDAVWVTTAGWANTTAALSVGRNGALTDFFSAADVKGTGTAEYTLGAGAGKSGYKFLTADTITAVLTAAGSSGTTGRTTLVLTLARPISTTAASKV